MVVVVSGLESAIDICVYLTYDNATTYQMDHVRGIFKMWAAADDCETLVVPSNNWIFSSIKRK